MSVSRKEFLDIQATTESRIILKCVRDIILISSQMHNTDMYSQHSWIIWPVWLNGWMFVHKLSGCEFESHCCHLNFRYRACFEQGVPWHLGNYSVQIHSEMHIWYDNIQSDAFWLTCSVIEKQMCIDFIATFKIFFTSIFDKVSYFRYFIKFSWDFL